MQFEIKDHTLVPKHERLGDNEATQLLNKYNITKLQLPKISRKDPAIKNLDIKTGNIIKITRDSLTAGRTVFYRLVINE